MSQEHWIFLSPHFDDVALSCGGLVWYMVNQGAEVQIWTIMAGFPPDDNYSPFAEQNQRNWGKSGQEAIQMRREEDISSCQILGAVHRHFNWPDVIYRKQEDFRMPVVNNDEELFNTAPEPSLVDDIVNKLSNAFPSEVALVLPMGLGGHLDHRAVVQAGEKLPQVDFYYADYPYILKSFDTPPMTEDKFQKRARYLPLEALEAWQESVLCYRSQLGFFWRDEEEAQLALRNYFAGGGGRLWEKI